jgi:two-component system, NarL family, nitrate/nitrite response regulator NarL
MNPLRIILADDHSLVRNGIRSLLSDVPEISIIADAASADELLSLLQSHADAANLPDVVVADISMPVPTSRTQTGLEAARIITETFPTVKILFLSMHEEAEYIINAMKSGALGYVLKNAQKMELVEAIQMVAAGKRYIPADVSARIVEHFSPIPTPKAPPPTPPVLTEREHDILECVVEGLSTKLIAEKLVISPRTVETHRNNIMRKLHAANTADLVRMSIEYGLVPPR